MPEKTGNPTAADKKSRGRLACATAFKRFFFGAYILLKVEAHSRPGKIIKAKIKLRGPGPAGLHFSVSSTFITVKYSSPGVNRNFLGYELIMINLTMRSSHRRLGIEGEGATGQAMGVPNRAYHGLQGLWKNPSISAASSGLSTRPIRLSTSTMIGWRLPKKIPRPN
jgi:hypothetical protein